ncbi:MAG: complex I subunit 5 family protein [Ignisphaera sp.]|uniref:NADH dehydrogenase n=1 Tax=Ignisphaera aggregans TaxID=334771 RepID=A0A7C4NN71_9CREN
MNNVVGIVIPLTFIVCGGIITSRFRVIGTALRILGYTLIGLSISFSDLFGSLILLTSIVIGVTIAAYTLKYSILKYGNTFLVPLSDLFLISMILVFTSQYLIEFVTFWLLTELLGFFLIAYDYVIKGSAEALYAAVKYLLFSMIPTDVALFIILALTGFEEAFTVPIKEIAPNLLNPVILTMVIVGFFSKAAVFPLHFWLPDAHSIAPAPASALLSGLMVKMGIYGLYLLSFYPTNKLIAAYIMLFSSFITVVYGALQASLQHDVKRLLAYSTTSNTALIASALALYMLSADKIFVEAAVLYTIAHALYKATMFLDSGFIELVAHERDIRRLGFISKVSPIETIAVITTILTILGMPPSTGFIAKVFLFTAISKYLSTSWIYIATLALASVKVAFSIIYNVVYLRSHYREDAQLNSVETLDKYRGVFGLQNYVFASSLSVYLIVIVILLIKYTGYIELELLKKMAAPLLISTILLIMLSLTIYTMIGSARAKGLNKNGVPGSR